MKKLAHALLDFLEIFIIASLMFALVYIFIGQQMEVSGNSMYPTYLDKERIIVEKVSLKFKPIERGEVVVFQHPQIKERHLLIKRVVGLPGETFRLSDGVVYINGRKLDEPYLENGTTTTKLENGLYKENIDYTISEDHYVLLGDNRSQSTDSRYFGEVSKESVIGRVFLVYFPLEKLRLAEQR